MTLGHSAVSPFSVDFLSASLELLQEARSHLIVVVVIIIFFIFISNQPHILSGQRADSAAVRVDIYITTRLEDLGTEAHEKSLDYEGQTGRDWVTGNRLNELKSTYGIHTPFMSYGMITSYHQKACSGDK